MDLQALEFSIVKPGTTSAFIIKFKPEWFNEEQAKTSICAEPYNVSGVGRNFRLIKNDI